MSTIVNTSSAGQESSQGFLVALDAAMPVTKWLHPSETASLTEQGTEGSDLPEDTPPSSPGPDAEKSKAPEMPGRELLSLIQLSMWVDQLSAMAPMALDTGRQVSEDPAAVPAHLQQIPLQGSLPRPDIDDAVREIPERANMPGHDHDLSTLVQSAADPLFFAESAVEHPSTADPGPHLESPFIDVLTTSEATRSPALQGPAGKPMTSHTASTGEGSDANASKPSILGLHVSPPVGELLEMEGEMARDVFSGEQQEAPTAEESERPNPIRTKISEPPVLPASYVETPQKTAVIDAGAKATPSPTLGHRPEPDGDPMPIITQLVDRMHMAMEEGHHELRLLLTPANLGTVRIDIAADRQDVHARLLVENPVVKDVIEENLYKLKDALQAQGLPMQDISVSVAQHFTQHESTATKQPFDERLWRAPRNFALDDTTKEIAGALDRAWFNTNSLQVDLFA
jgi:hypothetical protein